MSWFERLLPSKIRTTVRSRSVPEGVWCKCPSCDNVLYRAELERNLMVCPKCDHHQRINARTRLESFLDEEDRKEIAAEVKPVDTLKFKDSKRYKDRLTQAQRTTGENDALLAMQGRVNGLPLVAVSFDFNFMAGSMGSVVGEKFVRAAKVALKNNIPLVCFSASLADIRCWSRVCLFAQYPLSYAQFRCGKTCRNRTWAIYKAGHHGRTQ